MGDYHGVSRDAVGYGLSLSCHICFMLQLCLRESTKMLMVIKRMGQKILMKENLLIGTVLRIQVGWPDRRSPSLVEV